MTVLDIQPEVRAVLTGILSAYLQNGEMVYVFGSRAKGSARKYSDLDIAIDAHGRAVDFSKECALKCALEESDIPYRVDVVDWNSVPPEFKTLIKKDLVSLPYA
ncbi:MAG: nucleotidyltransferase domain-containing protein [Candidatus Margulisbacteria bacterium]|jgi:predicted nucleotidyltransferase|nr:nucleotidyltransferase domain-containing protein [Candidatus Margulisiibacteriota bacterium]